MITKEVQAMIDNLAITPTKLKEVVERKEDIIEAMKNVVVNKNTRIFLVGNGSSAEGLEASSYLWEKLLNIKPYVVNPFRFNHYPCELCENDIVLALSQTGTSHEVVESLRTSNKQGAQTIGITTVKGSPITKVAKKSIVVEEGIEFVDYKVVGVVVNMLAVYLVGYALALNMGRNVELEKDMNELLNIVSRYEETGFKVQKWVEENYEVLKNAVGFTVVGCGPLVEVAEELAIKTIEVTGVQSSFFDLEEYMHGGCAATNPNHVLIMIVGHDNYEFAKKCYNACVKYGKKVIWLGIDHPENKLNLTMSKDVNYAIYDAMCIVHNFIIKFGMLGGHGESGAKIFEFYQNELKVREG